MRELADRLIAHDAQGRKASDPKNAVGFHVCEKLRPHLSTVMGNGGFRVLLSRALTLATEVIPWLRGAQVNGIGSLEGLESLQAQLAPEEMHEGQVVLLAQLLGLLVAFVGESLTVRLLRDVWPQLPLGDSESGKGDNK